MVLIKTPEIADAAAISALMKSLGYPGTELFMERRIAQLISYPFESLLIAVDNKNIVGFETINSKLIILHYRAEEIGKYDKTKSSPK